MKTPILDFTEKNGLVFCAKATKARNNAEKLYLNEAQKLGIDAVLFRRYYQAGDDKPHRSEPAVCILNKDPNFFNSDEHIKLHAALWSAGKNEVYIIRSASRVDIINARKPAQPDHNGVLSIDVENILLASSEALNGINEQQFSAYLFCNGTFWEQTEFEQSLDENNSPYVFLLDYLMTVRKKFLSSNALQLRPETIDKLLVTSILIKFLEEITDDKGKHTLRSIYKKNRINSFSEAVEQGHCVTILNELANEFNGKIFDKFTHEEKENINSADLAILANLLRANINVHTNQMFLWEQYSFKHLPAEVISAIYENFIQEEAVRQNGEKEKGVVYTPIHLVNLLVDEVMPLNKPQLFRNNSFKILDPACGSGVFLVAAFKRMLQWWAINNSTKDVIVYPDSKTAQKILEDNIFGVDVKRTATLVSVFSLTTALLDKLTPQEIWNKLKFKDLSQKNIQHNNFFDWAIENKDKRAFFDLIIGNPPFNPSSGTSKKNVVTKEQMQIFGLKPRDIPDNNFALKFFEGGLFFAKSICMIIPSNIFLYNKEAQNYRNRIFTEFTVDKIFDFTHLRRGLFHRTADIPIVAIIAYNKGSEQQAIDHIVVKRMPVSEKKIRFEIDYYDHNKVKWDWAIDPTKSFLWKTNLLGGGRLFHLIYRLSSLNSLKDYIEDKKKNNGWLFNIGYIIGNSTQRNEASYITGQDSIVSVKHNGEIITEVETSQYFEAIRDKNLFTPPFLLLKDVFGTDNLPVYLIERHKNKHLAFKRKFTGLSAPKEDLDELRLIYDFIKNRYAKMYQLHIVATSSSAIVKQETYINKEDIESLPFDLERENYMSLSKAEQIIQDDVLNFYIHLGKAIGVNKDGHILHQKVNSIQLKQFGKTFCECLNEIYAKNDKYWQAGTVYQTELYTVYQFGFGAKGNLSYQFGKIIDGTIQPLVEDKLSNSGAVNMRIVRLYAHLDGYDCVFFIKPNAQRYWLNSIALRDADDTFVDFKKAGF